MKEEVVEGRQEAIDAKDIASAVADEAQEINP